MSAVDDLRELGFTDYEARVYLALLTEPWALSGYAIAQRSGVPRSKVYEVLQALSAKGVVHIAHGNPAQYTPIPPRDLVARQRATIERRLAAAELSLADYSVNAATPAPIWDLSGRQLILDRGRELIDRAASIILLELWAADADEIRPQLAVAAQRGVRIEVVAYGSPDLPFATVHKHPSTDEVTAGLGGRWLVLSIDAQEIVAGIVSSGPASRAAWSSHPGLVVPITELVKHDIYKLEMLAAHGDVLEATFGPDLVHLRERFPPLG